MAKSKVPQTPVYPTGMEVLFLYPCPHEGCGHEVALISPTQATMARCDACGKSFPVMPVDERALRYMKMMMANGKAAVDADFA